MRHCFELPTFPVLETNRLLLREISREDEAALFHCLSDEEVMRFWGMPALHSFEQAATLRQVFRRGFTEGRHIRWGIVRKEDSIFLGTCGFHSWDIWQHRCDIGYELYKVYWGHGYATEAVRAIASFAFSYLSVDQIRAAVHPENQASERVLLRAGFRKEGMLKNYMYNTNVRCDMQLFSLLPSPV